MKIALVTGNRTGIGKAISEFLVLNGYEVPLELRSKDYDLRQSKDCQKLAKDFIDKYGQIDLLVNNVGNYETGYIDECSADSWREMFASNTDSVFFLTKYLLPELRKSKGKILNLGFCGLEKLSAPADHIAYQAAKTATLVLTKAIAKEEAVNGLTVNMISPGSMENTIETDDCLLRIPMNRLGTLTELCSIVGLIISNDYLTGQNIEIAGGRAL
jgi:3-oxoacyl-[acyl-carrier protein] reductase